MGFYGKKLTKYGPACSLVPFYKKSETATACVTMLKLLTFQRLKHMTPRQTDQNLDALVARFHEKQIEMETIAFKERYVVSHFYPKILDYLEVNP